jgi:hypothetical protein
MPGFHEFELGCKRIGLRARRRQADRLLALRTVLSSTVPLAVACFLVLLGLAIIAAVVSGVAR